MKKMVLFVVVCLFCGFNTAFAEMTQAKWFNGNWLNVDKYGVSVKAGGTQEGEDAFKQVVEQKRLYAIAKEAGDLEGMFNNAFWTSVAAWALNNAAFKRLMAVPGNKTDAEIAELKDCLGMLEKAETLLTTAPELTPVNEAQVGAFKKEIAERAKALGKVRSNMLFTKRQLGLEPWPSK